MTSLLEFVRITDEGESKSFNNWSGPKWRVSRDSAGWMESRREENEDKKLWRIHDKLYDLTKFAATHPGGPRWINLTKGTDITEAFEAHHMSKASRLLLPKYFVKDATIPRNSPFTFKEDGFYNVLKEKAKPILQKLDRGASTPSKIFADTFITMCLVLSAIAASYQSYLVAFFAGACLCCTTVIAHNFTHQKDSFRMYYISLSGFNVEHWRVSHVLSHHIFPNSRHDLEITTFEPYFQWLPRPTKSFAARFLPRLYFPIFYVTMFHSNLIYRNFKLSFDGLFELIPLAIPASMILLGGVSLLSALFWWNVVVVMGSVCFACVGHNAAHHHPDIFHEGDVPCDEKEMDWGLYQLITVRDRVEIYGVFPLVILLFGDHTLHHMFPTIDHYYLPKLYPVLEETCNEFGIPFQLMTIWQLVKGQFAQMSRDYPVSFKLKKN